MSTEPRVNFLRFLVPDLTKVAFNMLSCGVVIVRKGKDEHLFLLLRAFSHWDFPKGMQEVGESALETAVREVKEESGITELNFKWTNRCIDTGPYGKGKIARYFLAETLETEVSLLVNPELGHPEHEEYRWAAYDQAKKMVTPRVRSVLEWAQGFVKYEAGF